MRLATGDVKLRGLHRPWQPRRWQRPVGVAPREQHGHRFDERRLERRHRTGRSSLRMASLHTYPCAQVRRHGAGRGQLQLRQRSPGSGGNRQIGASFVVAKTQGAICDPLRNQHHQHSNQAIELYKATRQWMQTTRGLGLGNGGHAARGDQSLPTLPGRFDQRGGSGQIARVPLRRGALTCAGGLGEGSRQRNGRS